MKTCKKILLITSCLFLTFLAAHGQSYETISKWDKDNASCVAIDVNAPEDIAVQSFFDLLKSVKLKGKKSKKSVSFEKIVFPSISSDYINLYGSVAAKDNNNSTIYVFINKGIGSDFMASRVDPKLIDNLKEFLNTRFAPVAAKANVDAKVAAQQKLVKSSGKDLSKMQESLDKKIKQKDKLTSEIESLTKQIEEQKTILEQHKTDLNNIVPQPQ